MLKLVSRPSSLHSNIFQYYQSSVRCIQKATNNYSDDESENILQSHSRFVICGSGLAGSSLAYHLSLLDHAHNTILLERGTISESSLVKDSGSSGLVGNFKHSAQQTALARYSINLLDTLASQGHDIGWKQCGSLRLARSHDRMTEYRRLKSISSAWGGVECNLVSPEECLELCPLIESSDIKGGLYVRRDGVLDKEKLRQVLLNEAVKRGVKVYENCEVLKVHQSDHKVEAVETNLGTVQCVYFVNAAGFWSRAIGQLSEPYVKVPLHPVSHQFIIAQANPDVISQIPCVLYDLDGRIYLREFNGKILAGGFEKRAKPAFEDGNLPDSPKKRFTIIKPDYDQFAELLEQILHRVPSLKDANFSRLSNIPEIFSPDCRWIMGESPEIENYYVAAGMMLDDVGGGIGKALADILINGYADIDQEIEVSRFLGLHNNRKYLRDRVKEIHSIPFDIQYPFREYETGRKLRMSPIFPVLQEAGAVFGQLMGYERPNYFDKNGAEFDEAGNPKFRSAYTKTFGKPHWFDIVASEYRACREKIGLCDYSSFTKIDLWSKDKNEIIDFLQNLCSNDVDIKIGDICHTGMQNEHCGGYENDCSLARLSENHFMMIAPTIQQTRCKAWIRRNLPKTKHGIHLNDITSAYTAICIMGPFSRRLLSELTDTDLSPKNFPFFTYKELDVGLANGVRTFNLTHTGELGYVLYIPNEFAIHVYTQLWEKGEKYGIKHCGYYAMRALRVEKFFAFWGQDLDTFTTPLECGRTWRVKFSKNFIGRDALIKQKDEGVKKIYIQLLLDDHDYELDVWPSGNEPIYRNGILCGRVTTASFGFTFMKQVCLGFVQNIEDGKLQTVNHDYILSGEFEVDICGIRFPCKVNLHSPNLPTIYPDQEREQYQATRE